MKFKLINRETERSWDGNTKLTVEAQDSEHTIVKITHSNMFQLSTVKQLLENEYNRIKDTEHVETLNIGDIF